MDAVALALPILIALITVALAFDFLIVQPVEEIEGQGDRDQGDQNRESKRDGVHG